MTKRKNDIILSILAIGTIIATAVGVTFAYFTATMNGTPANVLASTASVGTITFNGGADFTTANDIIPGWSESKTFSITVAPSDVSQTVYVKMTYNNNLPDLKCRVLPVEDGALGDVVLDKTGTDSTIVLVSKTFEANKKPQTVTYTLDMSFPDTGENQNESQGKTFEGTLFADLGEDSIYYTNQNPNGTTVKPVQ